MFKNKSILYRYMASFVCVAMLCCVVIGVTGYLLAAGEMRQSAANEQKKRLQLAAEDLYAQFDHLEEISHYVMTTAYYAPSYFSRNAYYELELLEDLAKQRTYNAIFDHLFLRYEGSPFFYTMTGKSWFKAYERLNLLTEEDAALLPGMLDGVEKLTFYPMKNTTIAIFPIRFTRTAGHGGYATLCFFLSHATVLERIQLVSSENFTRVAIFYEDECVMQTAQIEDPITVQQGKYTLLFDRNEIGVGVNNHFLRLSLWITFVFAALLCSLAIYVAVRNFRPIGNLAKRHNLQTDINELDHLDRTLMDMKSQLRISQEQLDERMTEFKQLRSMLQRYFVLQMVQGSMDEHSLDRMREAGMHFPGQTFYVFILQLPEGWDGDALEQTVEDLSDDNEAFYIVPFDGAGSYAVVINTDSGEELHNILREACPEAQVLGGHKTETLSEIPSLLFGAMAKAAPSCISPQDIAMCHADEQLTALKKALEEKDETRALQNLRAYCESYDGDDALLRQLMRSKVVSVMLSASYEANMDVPRSFLNSSDEMYTTLEVWASALCSRKAEVSAREEHRIIRYLREHALDYDLTLESIADHFRCSTRQITRMIQAETGGGYKDFVFRLRMEHAKEMLRNGESVNDTSMAVCYASRSHFIKSFTNYVGMTPSKYREHIVENGEAADVR